MWYLIETRYSSCLTWGSWRKSITSWRSIPSIVVISENGTHFVDLTCVALYLKNIWLRPTYHILWVTDENRKCKFAIAVLHSIKPGKSAAASPTTMRGRNHSKANTPTLSFSDQRQARLPKNKLRSGHYRFSPGQLFFTAEGRFHRETFLSIEKVCGIVWMVFLRTNKYSSCSYFPKHLIAKESRPETLVK